MPEEEKLRRYLNYVFNVLNGTRDRHDERISWHLAFGTLLYYIRDKKAGFPYEQDFDIGVFYDQANGEKLKKNFNSYQFDVVNELKDDLGNYLHLSFLPNTELQRQLGRITLDIFFWYKHGRQYYHCYEKVDGGFDMKGIDCDKLDGNPWKEYWQDDLMPCYIPCRFGSCLDEWYPGWMRRQPNFGVSKTRYSVVVPSFKAWKNQDMIDRQIEKSKAEYDQYIERLVAR